MANFQPHRNFGLGGQIGHQRVISPNQFNNNSNGFNNNHNNFGHVVGQEHSNFYPTANSYWGNRHQDFNGLHQQQQNLVHEFPQREIQLQQNPILNSPGKTFFFPEEEKLKS